MVHAQPEEQQGAQEHGLEEVVEHAREPAVHQKGQREEGIWNTKGGRVRWRRSRQRLARQELKAVLFFRKPKANEQTAPVKSHDAVHSHRPLPRRPGNPEAAAPEARAFWSAGRGTRGVCHLRPSSQEAASVALLGTSRRSRPSFVKAPGTCSVLVQRHPCAGPPPHLRRFWRRGPGCLRRPSALNSKGESSRIKAAPTIVKQQQRQKNGHPLLLDPPVPHGKLPEGVAKQALQTRLGLGHGHGLGLGSCLAQYHHKPAPVDGHGASRDLS